MRTVADIGQVRHDRYLIYRLLGRQVRFVNSLSRASKPVSGIVKKVCRDIFSNAVELTLLNGKTHQIKEPTAIIGQGGDVVFLYGPPRRNTDEEDDREFFDAIANGGLTRAEVPESVRMVRIAVKPESRQVIENRREPVAAVA